MMGVPIEQIPSLEDLGDPRRKCCHGCMRVVGATWYACCHDDLSWWRYAFCWRCVRLGLGGTPPKDAVERQWLERFERYKDNHRRWRERSIEHANSGS